MTTATATQGLKLYIKNYEGPFDLLLQAIDDGKLDIHAISLTELTNQYLAYLKELPALDLDAASEYLVMAAYLIELKSKMLLPQPEDPILQEEEEQIELDLAAHLMEYKFYKDVAVKLRDKQQNFFRTYSRYHREVQTAEQKEIFLVDITLEDLVKAFQNLYNEVKEEEPASLSVAEEISLPQRIEEVVNIISRSAGGEVEFEKLFLRRTRVEVVVTFLAILELARQRKIRIFQGKEFGGIKLGWLEN